MNTENNAILHIEEIPDEDIVYRRIHKNHIDNEDKSILPVTFPTEEDGLSVNWAKYSTPQETKDEAKFFSKDPNSYGIVSLKVASVRNIPLRVIHSPRPHNISHSSILDIPPRKPNDLGIRLKLRNICNWIIHI